MNELQKQKAVEVLERKKAKERKQRLAMMYHLFAFSMLHFEHVLLPYKILYDIERQEYEGIFKEIKPNPYYPHPGVTLETEYSKPPFRGDYKSVTTADGTPDFRLDEEYRKKLEEYQQRIEAEKMKVDMWGFWYARFLLPYDLESFSDFDYWGEKPKDDNAKEIVANLREACIKAQADCRKHPEEYNLEPVPRLEEHKTKYDVGYGYIR
ncbi:MAG: hypothetical protein OSJ23_09285 [Mucispirillum schaedleri]|nr:hypothetical protein [Mucispirillum schaedleri]